MISYTRLLQHVISHGQYHADRTGVGTYSVFGYQWCHDMTESFPLVTQKKVPLRWVFEELRWFLSGSTNEADLRRQGIDIWQEWATAEECAKFGREPGDLGPIYGKLWRDFDGVDQIKQLLVDICSNPNSRRLIVTGWHPALSRQVTLPPCHTSWQVKCYPDGGISLLLWARSIDAFLGLPFNMASYGLLLEMLAKVTGRTARTLTFMISDLHIYSNHMAQAREAIIRPPRGNPRVRIHAPSKADQLEQLLSIQWGDIELQGYEPHPKIEAPVAI